MRYCRRLYSVEKQKKLIQINSVWELGSLKLYNLSDLSFNIIVVSQWFFFYFKISKFINFILFIFVSLFFSHFIVVFEVKSEVYPMNYTIPIRNGTLLTESPTLIVWPKDLYIIPQSMILLHQSMFTHEFICLIQTW